MAEQRVCKVFAQVMIYNDQERRWFHAGESGVNGQSAISILSHEKTGNSRIVAQKVDNNREVTVNMNIVKSLKYHQATKTFHQWRDQKTVYGLNFQNEEHAEQFSSILVEILEHLRQTSGGHQMSAQSQPPVVSSAQHHLQGSGSTLQGFSSQQQQQQQPSHAIANHYASNGHNSTPQPQRTPSEMQTGYHNEQTAATMRANSNSSPTMGNSHNGQQQQHQQQHGVYGGISGGGHGSGHQQYGVGPAGQTNGYQESYSADSLNKVIEPKMAAAAPPAAPPPPSVGGPPAPPPPPPPPPMGGGKVAGGGAAPKAGRAMPVSLQDQLNRNNRANLRPVSNTTAPAVSTVPKTGTASAVAPGPVAPPVLSGGNFLDELKRRQQEKKPGGRNDSPSGATGVVAKSAGQQASKTGGSAPAWKQQKSSSPSASLHNIGTKMQTALSINSSPDSQSAVTAQQLCDFKRELLQDIRVLIREELQNWSKQN